MFQRRNIRPIEIRHELCSAISGGLGNSSSSSMKDKVKVLLQNVWQTGFSRQDGVRILNFLLSDENIGHDQSKVVFRNFLIVMFKFISYAIYCVDNNMVGTHLCCKLLNGKKQMFGMMKLFITSHESTANLDDTARGLFMAVFKKNEVTIGKLELELTQVLNKDLTQTMNNLKRTYPNKVKKGVWKNQKEYHCTKSSELHKDVLEWLGLL